MSKNCYAAINAGNRALADKTCPKVDDAKNACTKPIDASDYLGVTYDVSEGYNSQGFRGSMIKKWCREGQKYKDFDVPDGMHIMGVYETAVTTKTYSSVHEYIKVGCLRILYYTDLKS